VGDRSPQTPDLQLLADGLSAIGYEPDAALLKRFAGYLAELALWNPKLRLVAASGRDLITRHLLDCAAAVRVIMADADPALPVVDAGSGAGLPGLVLAMLHPEAHVELVERSGRRVGFLRNARVAAGVPGVGIAQTDLAGYREEAGALTSRAFLPLSDDLLAAFARIVPEGTVYALKGRRSAIDEELATVTPGEYGFSVEIVPVHVPFLEEERHLLVLRR
jgi:16S rRNA (guanine527-N7)-methyltransferase